MNSGLSWPSFGRNIFVGATLPHLLLVIASFKVQSCETSSGGSSQRRNPPDAAVNSTDWRNAKSVYDFTVKSMNGEPVSLRQYRGKVLLIVNVATKEGWSDLTSFTYTQLFKMHNKYHDRGFRVLAFPCSQFRNMTPRDNGQLIKFSDRFLTQFDMFDKVDVNGENASPLWRYLKQKLPGLFGRNIKWNYTKFIIDRNGIPVKRFAPVNIPLRLERLLEKHLD